MTSTWAETLFLSSVSVAELTYGIRALPKGKRQEKLTVAPEFAVDLFNGGILPFDVDAAQRYASLAVRARAAGKGFPTPDGYIGAIADAHGFAVASGDTSAFTAAGLSEIDPWSEST